MPNQESKISAPSREQNTDAELNQSRHEALHSRGIERQLKELSVPANQDPRATWDLSSSEIAFAGVSNRDLGAKSILFSMMGNSWLNQIADKCIPIALRVGLPIKGLIRNTIYRQFCGGEDLNDVCESVKALASRGVDSIVDYAVEGEQTEQGFDGCAEELSRVINLSKNQPDISYVAVKYTGLISSALLEKQQSGSPLTADEQAAYSRFIMRVSTLAQQASDNGVKLFVDAEESWIQGMIDSVTTDLMRKFNREKATIHTTLQMYRTDRLGFLGEALHDARENGYILGLKLVRGAYMEKERDSAAKRSQNSPIHPTKTDTDNAFDEALSICLSNLRDVHLCIASHNTASCSRALELMQTLNLPFDHERVCFAQLYGMSDALSFGLAAAGARVSKYLPYGPVEKVLPYLIRRAKENSAVRGQTGRELSLIRSEMVRRRSTH